MARPHAVPLKLWADVVDELNAVTMAWGAYRSAHDAELKNEADMLIARAERELDHKLRTHSLDTLTCTRRYHREELKHDLVAVAILALE